jgi:hypothetical protein
MTSNTSSSNVYSPVTDISFNDVKHPNSGKKDTVSFWGENPNVLFQNLTEWFPTDDMTYNQSLNAITRLVILFALISFFMTGSIRLLFILAITLGAIYFLWLFQTEKREKKKVRFSSQDQENFQNKNIAKALFEQNGETVPGPETFLAPSTTNPFGNTLMTDYDYNPNKKPAPPSFNANVNEDILNKSKQMVIDANPGQPDIADKLFHDLGEQLIFEQSMRPFYSNASTTIPNDQTSFAEFCYGSMVSCKEGNKFACARNLGRYTNI